MKSFDINIESKPTKEAEELASHELPILRKDLLLLDNKRSELIAKIQFYEDIINARNGTSYKAPGIEIERTNSEYSKLKTYAEKILFITQYPAVYGKDLIEGKGDIVSIIYNQEKNRPFTDIIKLQKKLNSSIPSVLSRLIGDEKLFKYRYKGTKGKFVLINPCWLVDGSFKEEYKHIVKDIEPTSNEEAPLSEAS